MVIGQHSVIETYPHDGDGLLRVVVAVQVELRVLVLCEEREERAPVAATDLDNTLRTRLYTQKGVIDLPVRIASECEDARLPGGTLRAQGTRFRATSDP